MTNTEHIQAMGLELMVQCDKHFDEVNIVSIAQRDRKGRLIIINPGQLKHQEMQLITQKVAERYGAARANISPKAWQEYTQQEKEAKKAS